MLALLLATPAVVSPADAPAQAATPTLSTCEQPDHGLPNFVSATFDRAALDVRAAPGEASVVVEVTDPGGPGPASGIAKVSVWLSGYASGGPFVDLHPSDATHWTATFRVARGIPSGTWTIFRVTMQDHAGNSDSFGDEFGEDLPATLHVRGVADRRKPEVEVSLSRSSVDVRHRGTRVQLRAHISDNRGVRFPGFVVAEVEKADFITGSDRTSVVLSLHRTRGSTRNGLWVASLRVRQYDPSGQWTIEMKVADPAGNFRRATAGPLRVRAARDKDRPLASQPTAAPQQVDVRRSAASVTLTARLRDVTSGLRRAFVMLLDPAPGLTDVPVSRTLRLVSGTRHDGVWSAVLPVPRCGLPPGRLKLRLAAFDWADRAVTLFGSDFRITVAAEDTSDPTATLDVSGLPNRLTVTFNEPVTGLTSETAQVRRHTDSDPVPAEGSWSCSTRDGAPTDCATGELLRAVYTLGLPMRDANYDVGLNPEFTLGLMDLAGNAPRDYGVQTP